LIVLGEYATTYYDLDFYEDETATTIYAIGSPNQGKSTLLGNLAEQFCAAGEGVLVLDIKGDMVQDIATRTRNPDRTVYVKLGEIQVPGMDTRYWTFNPFEGHRESLNRMNHIRTSVLESFERMGMAQLDTMANIRNTLQHAIELSLTLPDPTYVDLYAIVASQSYRKSLLGRGSRLPPLNQKFWQDLDNKEVTTSFQRRQQINTTRNRMEWMLSTPNFNIPAGTYQSTLLLRQWLDEGKMVLVDLGLPLDQYTAINLGNMITAQLMTEIFTRENRDRRWRIVVDEFHNFVGDPFAEIITAARSYNVFCVLAHQDRGQLAGDRLANVRSAIGHAGITVRMRGSRQDRMDLIGLYVAHGAGVLHSFPARQ
jgi:type IV secretory pathway VirB4 component